MLIDIIKAELEEKQFKVKLTVIDTPGFGDYVNNKDSWTPIVDFIVRFPSPLAFSLSPSPRWMPLPEIKVLMLTLD